MGGVGVRTELERALDLIQAKVRSGVRHGYFEYGITCETVNEKKRRLTVKVGETHLFVISEHDLHS